MINAYVGARVDVAPSTRCAVNVTAGQLRNQTVLPLPPISEQQLAEGGKDTLHILEGAVSTWTRQIKQVLSGDPDAALKEPGSNPGPLAELDFWEDRASQLSSIWEQLCRDSVQSVVRALEQARSTFAAPFGR
jgi:dynein heavy chain